MGERTRLDHPSHPPDRFKQQNYSVKAENPHPFPSSSIHTPDAVDKPTCKCFFSLKDHTTIKSDKTSKDQSSPRSSSYQNTPTSAPTPPSPPALLILLHNVRSSSTTPPTRQHLHVSRGWSEWVPLETNDDKREEKGERGVIAGWQLGQIFRTRAESQRIVAARPLCRLQYPVRAKSSAKDLPQRRLELSCLAPKPVL